MPTVQHDHEAEGPMEARAKRTLDEWRSLMTKRRANVVAQGIDLYLQRRGHTSVKNESERVDLSLEPHQPSEPRDEERRRGTSEAMEEGISMYLERWRQPFIPQPETTGKKAGA